MDNNIICPVTYSNYFRLSALVLNTTTNALRGEFEARINQQFGTLANALKHPPIQQMLTNFHKIRKILNPSQFNLLYPTHGKADVHTFDITLLVFLFKNLLSISTGKWPPNPPDKADLSLAADIVRITDIRNKLGHKSETRMETIEFDDHWSNLEKILLRLNVDQAKIDECKQCVLSSDDVERYKNALKAQTLDDITSIADQLTDQITGNLRDKLNLESERYIPKYNAPWISTNQWSWKLNKVQTTNGKEQRYLVLKVPFKDQFVLVHDSSNQESLYTLIKEPSGGCRNVSPSNVYYISDNSKTNTEVICGRPCKYDIVEHTDQSVADLIDNSTDNDISIKFINDTGEFKPNIQNSEIGMVDYSGADILYVGRKIICLDKLDKERIVRKQNKMSPYELAMNMQGPNIIAALKDLDDDVIEGLVVKLKSWSIITSKEQDLIFSRKNRLMRLQALIDVMEGKAADDIQDFITIIKFKEETFLVGCLLQVTIKFGKQTLFEEETVTAPDTDLKASLKVSAKRDSNDDTLIKLIQQNLRTFKDRVLKVLHIDSVSEGCINITLNLEDQWEMKNLKRDIECGIFFERYSLWLQENDMQVPKDEVEIKLVCGDVTEVVYNGKFQSVETTAAEKKLTKDDLSKQEKASDSKLVPKIPTLNDLDYTRIQHILRREDTTPQCIAMNMTSATIVAYLNGNQQLIRDLDAKKVLSIPETTNKSLEEIISIVANKEPDAVEEFIKCLGTYSKPLEKYVSRVYEYCSLQARWDIRTISLDIGTTFTRCAYSPDRKNINMKMEERSIVLVNQDGLFVAYGHDALQRKKFDNENHLHLYDCFKFAMDNQIPVIRSSPGKYTSEEIYLIAMKYVLYILGDMTDHVEWMIPVPSSWSDDTKQKVREAAYKAGLIGQVDARNLYLINKVDAASYGLAIKQQVPANKDYMLVSAGGGYTDFACYLYWGSEIPLPARIGTPTTLPVGGLQGNQNFATLLTKMFGLTFIDSYKEKYPAGWYSVLESFEESKCKSSQHSNEISITMPSSMQSMYKDETPGKTLENDIKKSSSLGVSSEDGVLILGQECVKSLYQPVIEEIIQHMQLLMIDIECEGIVLSGGFGQSHLLQDAIRKEFIHKRLVVACDKSIVPRGAVLYRFPDAHKVAILNVMKESLF